MTGMTTIRQRSLARRRRTWLDAGPACPLVAGPASEQPSCELAAWLAARATAKKRPLSGEARRP